MAYFVFMGIDKPGAEPTRLATRDAHRAYIYQEQPGCRLVSAGPMASDDDSMMIGTFLMFDAADRAAVERFVQNDPYNHAGIFERTEIHRVRWNYGLPAGLS